MAKKKVVTSKKNIASKQKIGTKTVKVNSPSGKKAKVKPTQSRLKSSSKGTVELTFNKENYKWIGIGLGLIMLGMILMMGGAMPSPDIWDDSIIYNFRRITLSPLVIVAGLSTVVYGIFK